MKLLPRVATLAAMSAIAIALIGPGARAQVLVGKRAPDFVLPDLFGRSVSLSEARGRIILLAFFKST